MATKTEAYVDTSAFIAALDRSDSFHLVFAQLFSDPPALVTSSLVVAEGHGWFLRRYDTRKALDFLRFVRALTPLTICPLETDDIPGVTALLGKFADRRLTMADAHGLALMKHRRIRHCWSTDRHLGLTGVPLVI